MHKERTVLRILSMIVTLFSGISSTSVWAQAQSKSPSSSDILEEIVVTAQKREENLLDVPISVSSISGTLLQDRTAYSFYDLSQLAADVVAIQTGDNLHSQTSIRGVSSYANDIGQQSSVGMFVDGVFMARTGMATSQDFADVDRIEVLRGPQGTLFGMNTAAGMINIITRNPDLHNVGGYAELAAGQYNTLAVRATVTGPLIQDTLGASLSVYHDSHDGYEFDPVIKQPADNLEKSGIKGKVEYKSDNFDGIVSVDLENERSQCCSAVITNLVPGANALGIPIAPLAPAGYPYSRETIQNFLDTNPSHGYGLTANLNWNLSDFTLTSLAAYRFWAGSPYNDVDGLSLHLIDDYLLQQTHQQLSEEFRLTSPSGKKLEYIVGVFYYNRHSTDHESLSLGSDVPDFFKVPDSDAATINRSRINDTTYAVFGHVDYHWTDQFTTSAGARYTQEPQNVYFIQTSNNFAYPNLGSTSQSRNDGAATWMADVSYKWTPHITTYATVATGFKPGGFDVLQLSTFDGFQFHPETNTNYEAGLKSSLFDNRATLIADVFYTRYKNFQTQAFNGLNLTTTNAGSFVTQGAEIEVAVKPVAGLTLTTNASFVNAHYTDFTNGQCPYGSTESVCNLTGQRLYNAPRWTVNSMAEYERPVTARWNGFVLLDASYKSQIYFQQNLDPHASQDGYTVFDARIGAKSGDGLKIEAFASNLFNKDYVTLSFPTAFASGVYAGYVGAPRVLGVRVAKSF
jgi:iron complex outermembrane receptor protein